ncbi:kelch motif family protein [Stylonychia lemnae]|uniref:Kelch motif family protein n=1 Tax=Stylonychia lemnae TaxID=5949 RepID=A0A078AF91_STYLE|nr:kelch motif family protein [Stylonychia lemnae]|eukprot:CDW80511.1 kelch motif family protein [Stylonychia lemnae]
MGSSESRPRSQSHQIGFGENINSIDKVNTRKIRLDQSFDFDRNYKQNSIPRKSQNSQNYYNQNNDDSIHYQTPPAQNDDGFEHLQSLNKAQCIICKETYPIYESSENDQSRTRVFIIGGYIDENGGKDIKAVNWNLEYIKEPCFIQPKSGMLSNRFNHCMIFDEKRGRIYVFGGLSDTQSIKMMFYQDDSDEDDDFKRPNSFLQSGEYYDLKNDNWVNIKNMHSHREQATCTIFKEDYVYLFGGIDRFSRDPYSLFNTIDKYNISNDDWYQLKIRNVSLQLTIIRACSLQISSKEIIIFGGKQGNENRRDSIYEYNVETNELILSQNKLPSEIEFHHPTHLINGVHYMFGWNNRGLLLLSYSMIKQSFNLVNQMNI